MRSLAISSVALAALMVSQPAFAEIDSGVGAPPVSVPGNPDQRGAMPAPPVAIPGTPDTRAPVPVPMAMQQTGRRLDYQRPSYGFQLPQTWMSSEHAVDYREHGLDRPAAGFGWSRYYNDMVLTDQWGRVYDVADGYDRDDRRGHGGRYRGRDTDGIAGGVAGAAVGAVAGNLIAGAGSRLAGSLIGGGVGALVGLGVELALKKGKHRGPRYDDRAHEGGYDRGHGGGFSRGHWGGYPAQSWGYQC